MSLGTKIRDLRIAKGLTQTDLARGLVTPSMISQIETNKANPSYKVLEAIAKKLETPLEYFLSDVQVQMEKHTVHKLGQALLAAKNYEKALELLEPLDKEKDLPNIEYFVLYLNLGECYLHMNRHEEAFFRFEQACQLAEQNGKPYEVIQALNKMGVVEMQRKKYHSASFHWKCAYKRFEELSESEPFIKSDVLMNLGKLYRSIGEVDESLKYFQMNQELLRHSNQLEQMGLLYIEFAMSYEKIRDYTRASEYSQYAIALFESLNHIKTSLDVKRQYGVVKGEAGEYAGAFEILSECLKEYEDYNYLTEATIVHGEIANLYISEKKFVEAKLECKSGLAKTSGDRPEAATLLRYLAVAEDSLGRSEEAIQSLEQALVIFQAHQFHTDAVEMYSLLGELYQKTGDLERANDCLQKMKQSMKDNLNEWGIAW